MVTISAISNECMTVLHFRFVYGCVTTAGKLFSPVALSPNSIIWYRSIGHVYDFTKVTSRPGFSGQSRFLTTCPGKNHSSPGTPICPVFGLVLRICPDLPISAAVCTGGQKLAQSLSVYTK